MDKAIPQDLIDPITLDLMSEPVNLPCCGRAISRESISNALQRVQICPLCRQDLTTFDPVSVPKAVNLAYLIEKFKNPDSTSRSEEPSQTTLTAKIKLLTNNQIAYRKIVGKLCITSPGNQHNYKNLMLLVIDKSGSMSGSPIKQVKQSIKSAIDSNYRNKHVLTELITYSNNAVSTELCLHHHVSHWDSYIDDLEKNMAGTSFTAAFEEIAKVCRKYAQNTNISSVTIIFLTDGQDSLSDRKKLVTDLKTQMDSIWTKPYTVHTVGFGSNHDSEFLNSLRKIGTEEGAYRFADPNENLDILSSKINSVLDVVFRSSPLLFTVTSGPNSPPIIHGSHTEYWVDLSKFQMSHAPYVYSLSIGEETYELHVEVEEAENEQTELWEQWCSYLIDRIADELIGLSTKLEKSIDTQIHCELIRQRMQAIRIRLSTNSTNIDRLDKLTELLKTINVGNSLNTTDKLRLVDLKYEGQFSTKITTDRPATIAGTSAYVHNTVSATQPKSPWVVIKNKRYKRCCSDNKSAEIFQIISRSNIHIALENIHRLIFDGVKDKNGSSVLCAASAIGRYKLIKDLCGSYMNKSSLTEPNKYGDNPVDVAVLYGYWKTLTILLDAGLEPNHPWEDLFTTALSRGFIRVAKLILDRHKVIITEELENASPNGYIAHWLSLHSNKDMDIDTAISRSIIAKVEEKINTVTSINLEKHLTLLTKPSKEQQKIVDLLIKHNKIDLFGTFKEPNDTDEITWPLFIAAETGNTELANTIMEKISDTNYLNKQNNRGTTALWIACCNKHTDIVIVLLTAGADPNITNNKGDSPLVACIQKGAESIVQILLDSGARLDAYNKNRDNPILIACRNGQARILETLLKSIDSDVERKKYLETYAEIDGFCPIFASTELDRVDCIKVCHKYHPALLEDRTSDTNPIIAGATPLHLACFYGRLASVSTLVSLGADLASRVSVSGYTPLHIAVKQGHAHVVRFLLQVSDKKLLLDLEDNKGHKPIYYAKTAANQELYDEFFGNKLISMFDQMLCSSEETEQKCSQVLSTYGQSLGCYNYSDVINIDMGSGSTLLSQAILGGNITLTENLIKIGADIYKPDDYGIKAIFWATYLGLKLDLVVDEDTQQQLEQITRIKSQSFQNKLLTKLDIPQTKVPRIEFNSLEFIPKMTHSHQSVNHTVSNELIEGSHSKTLSIFGFLDKLKSSKEFSPGKSALEYLLREATIHIIRLFASKKIPDTVQPLHAAAIYMYISNDIIFQRVNEILTNWENNTIWRPFLFSLYQGLTLLSPIEAEVYRAIDTPFDSHVYQIGSTVCWNTFSLCSMHWQCATDLITRKCGMIFIIKSRSVRKVSDFSIDPANEEVMFLPGTCFTVTNYYRPDVIALGQANIRSTTFAIRDIDIERAIHSKASIIVELTEVNVDTIQ